MRTEAYIVSDFVGIFDKNRLDICVEIYLDGFVCQRDTSPGLVFTAHAVRVGFEVGDPLRAEDDARDFFNGTNHLVFLVDGKLSWVCKDILLQEWKLYVTPKLVVLANPRFLVREYDDTEGRTSVGGSCDFDASEGETKMRPAKDKYFMDIAEAVGRRSTCLRHKIGAILVDSNNRVVSTGYNGAPAGMAHCLDVGCVRDELGIESGTQIETCRGIHAEQNALLQAESMHRLRGGTCYCVYQPCVTCAKLLINAGVLRVVYSIPYKDELAKTMLNEAGIIQRRME